MIDSAIRELAAAADAPLVCAAFVDTTIQAWDISTQQQIVQFDGRFESGANNLAVHPDGSIVVSGISAKNGILSAYKTQSGMAVWQKSRVVYPARLRFSLLGNQLTYITRNRRLERIDGDSGLSISSLDGVLQCFDDASGDSLIARKAGYLYSVSACGELSAPERSLRIEKSSFYVLDAAFAPDSVYLTEAGGSVRCIEAKSGIERWKFNPPSGSHVLRLHYNSKDDHIYGILWHFERGLFRQLVRWDRSSGRLERVCELCSWAEVFVRATEQLVTSAGGVIDIATGRVAGQLAFPRMRYPG